MKIEYFQVLEDPTSPLPEGIAKRMFSTFEKCREAAEDVRVRYPGIFTREITSNNIYIKKFEMEIE